ncbi:HEAT repeat domain-containing protein [Shewanella sp. A3A]|nr:HEAT repeat domain-containing protein [Shewanella ferrihydritica]
MFRLGLIRVIGEAKKSCLTDFDLKPLHSYVLKFLKSKNKMIRMRAITALNGVGDVADYEVLKNIVFDGDDAEARAAIDSIILIEPNYGVDYVKNLSDSINNEMLYTYAKERASYFSKYHFSSVKCNNQ